MPRGSSQASQQIRPCGSATPLNDQASPTASSGLGPVCPPAPLQRSTRMKRVFGRRNSLSLQQIIPTPFILDHVGSVPPTEDDSLSPPSARVRAASTDHGMSALSETPLGVDRPAPPHPHTSRMPLRHLIPTSLFHPGPSSSLSNKRSPSSDSIKVSSPPPDPPPKPSKLRVGGRSAQSSGSEQTSNEFGQSLMEHSTTVVTADYNPSDFRFPPKHPIQSKPSSSMASQPDIYIDPRHREPGHQIDSPVTPRDEAGSRKMNRNPVDVEKRRSMSLGDITAFPTTGHSAGSTSSSGLRFPAHANRAKSSDSTTVLSTSTSDGSNSGTETSLGSTTRGFSQIRSTSLATGAPPQTARAQSTLPWRHRVVSAADSPCRSSPEPAKSLASSASSSGSGSTLPPPRHPGSSASLSVPGRAAAADRIGRSSSPLRDTARSAAVGGFLLGRKGWDRMERLWSSSASSSTGISRPSAHPGHRNAEASLSSSDLAIASSLGDSRINLSACLRPPRRQGGGLVFGRSLADATRDTAVGPDVLKNDPWVDDQGTTRGENCPALVVRCVQHLEKWGIEEEGLFRISGRNTHTARLRSEFDAGADYDLRQSDPVDLDPHSVSSVFKNFLREMPEPIMTHALSHSFDDVLNSAFGDAPASFRGQRTAARPLINDLQRLIWRLPAENRCVLRELCRLLRRTSDHSATTKMPLSNLALVFCPTLSMHPNVFSLLVRTQDDIFEPMPTNVTAVLEEADEVNVDLSSEESEQEESRSAPLLHQRSMSDMKLMHLTEMSQRNRSFGRVPPASLAPIVVPISVSASSSAPSTSVSTSYTSETPSLNTDSSAPTSPYSSQSTAATWGKGSKKHMHNVSLPLPAGLSHVFTASSSSSSSSLASSIPFRGQRGRQGSTTSTIDEEHDAMAPRPRTPSTLRALGALLNPRSRSNTFVGGSTPDSEPAETTPTTPRNHNARWSPGGTSSGPSTPGRLSRRSSLFFPSTPKLDKLEWGFGSASSGSLPARVRKGSVGNLKSLVSAPLATLPEKASERLKLPHLSMTIPGGGTGTFLTSPVASPLAPPSPSSPTPTATAPVLPSTPPVTSRRPSESLSNAIHVRVTSSGTVTVNKRWSGTSNSSKRWSGTGSTMTGRSGSKRASWSEPPVAVPAAQVDSTPAVGSSSFSSPISPTVGCGDIGFPGRGVKSRTPIADLFGASSSSVELVSNPSDPSQTSGAYTSGVDHTVVAIEADIPIKGRNMQRNRSGTLPFPALSISSSPPVAPGIAAGRGGLGGRPLPTPPSHPPSSFTGGGGGSAGHVKSAIAALTQVKQSASYAPNGRSNNSAVGGPASTLSAGGSNRSSLHPPSLPPRLGFGGLRKKHWSRTSAVSTASTGKESEEDWATTVLAQITGGAAHVISPPAPAGNSAAANSYPGSSAPEREEGKEQANTIVEASAIPDGTVRDARRLFEDEYVNN